MAAAISRRRFLDRSHYNKGLEYFEKGAIPEAIIEFRNAIQQEPRFADAHYHLSLASMSNKDGQSAMKEMLRASSLDPDNNDANLKMAGMLLLALQPDESLKYVMKVLDKDVNYNDDCELWVLLFLPLRPPCCFSALAWQVMLVGGDPVKKPTEVFFI